MVGSWRLCRYYHEGKGSDPIVHFYESFLAQYDPAERERRGVYYTPDPVVGYIVRSLHGILKSAFGKPDGLAADGVTLLDPAAGTMTFIARAAQVAVAEFEAKYGQGGRGDFIRRHILQNFYAFELMMAPYAVGHLKMSFFLEELGHRLTDDERYPAVPDIFPVNSVGIVTARDALTIHGSERQAWNTVTTFSKMEPELARKGYGLGKDARDWKVALAEAVQETGRSRGETGRPAPAQIA